MSKVIPLDQPDNRKAELTLVLKMEELEGSSHEQNEFLNRIGCSRGEYEHLKRKYNRVLERWRWENSVKGGDADET